MLLKTSLFGRTKLGFLSRGGGGTAVIPSAPGTNLRVAPVVLVVVLRRGLVGMVVRGGAGVVPATLASFRVQFFGETHDARPQEGVSARLHIFVQLPNPCLQVLQQGLSAAEAQAARAAVLDLAL